MALSLSAARLFRAEVATDGDSLRELPTTSEDWKPCVITSTSFFFFFFPLSKAVLQPHRKSDRAARAEIADQVEAVQCHGNLEESKKDSLGLCVTAFPLNKTI